jgi:hypothetical protein
VRFSDSISWNAAISFIPRGISQDRSFNELYPASRYSGNCNSSLCPDWLVQLSEDPGPRMDYQNYLVFGVANSARPTLTFAFDSRTDAGPLTSTTGVLYGEPAPLDGLYTVPSLTGPVTSGLHMVGEGFVTGSGSIFENLASNRVRIRVAHELKTTVFRLSSSP